MTSRLCMVLVVVLGLPAALCAQKQQGSWSDLRGLKVGQGIIVIEASMKHHDGEFISVSDDVLTLQEKGSDVSVKREEVVRVSTASGARRGEHAVIGLVVGGVIGAAIGAIAADRQSTGNGFWSWKADPGIGALVGIVIGAPSGAAVGAVIPAHTTVYRAAPAAAHQRISNPKTGALTPLQGSPFAVAAATHVADNHKSVKASDNCAGANDETHCGWRSYETFRQVRHTRFLRTRPEGSSRLRGYSDHLEDAGIPDLRIRLTCAWGRSNICRIGRRSDITG